MGIAWAVLGCRMAKDWGENRGYLSQMRHWSSIRLNNLFINMYVMGGLDFKAGHNHLPACKVPDALQVLY